MVNFKSKEDFGSILVFESLLTIGEDKVYGFIYNQEEWDDESNREWVEYMAGCKKWIESGNIINENKKWVDKSTGLVYDAHSDEFAMNYCKQAYIENPIPYFIKENFFFDYAEEEVDGPYIVSERFWQWTLGQIDKFNECEGYDNYLSAESDMYDESDYDSEYMDYEEEQSGFNDGGWNEDVCEFGSESDDLPF